MDVDEESKIFSTHAMSTKIPGLANFRKKYRFYCEFMSRWAQCQNYLILVTDLGISSFLRVIWILL